MDGSCRRVTRTSREWIADVWGRAGVVLALAVSAVVLPAAATLGDTAPQNPLDPETPPTVAADALPTVQINGVVWTQAVSAGLVYAGGSFSSARPAGSPPGSHTVTRRNMLAYSVRSGRLVQGFAPSFNGQVRAVAVSPDGSRVYVGGNFTAVNGVRRGHIAALDPSTGALVRGFAPPVNSSVNALVVAKGVVYAGGDFTSVGNKPRARLAAFRPGTGALLAWHPSANGGSVKALALSPDGSRLVAGGSFTTLDGSSEPGYGLGAVSTATGALLPFAVSSVIRNAGTYSGITSLSGDSRYVYGTAFKFQTGAGPLEGVFSAGWDGTLHWVDDCHGDTYSAHPQGDVIYVAGHSYNCSNIGGFPESAPPRTHYRAIAFGRSVTGVDLPEPNSSQYTSYAGLPTSSVLTWFPEMNVGSYTGQNQGPWSVAGNRDYVVMGGEFTRVNGKAQQGLVRYAVSDIAPNQQGPRLFGDSYPIEVSATLPGHVQVDWSANYDRDNEYLTYSVFRDGGTSADRVYKTRVRAPFWNLVPMQFTDSGLAGGSTHRYQVVVSDPFGNVAKSPWADVTVM